ncbi:MAG: 4Fe-4S binding protein [Candidatus Coatesbacteria bacterium]
MIRPLVLAAVMSALSWRVYAGRPAALGVALVWSALVAAGAAWMEARGRLALYRRVYFAVLAACFLLQMHLPRAGPNLEPYCHLGLAGNALHTGYNQFLAIAGGTWGAYGPLSLGLLWLLVVLACGGSLCGWVCFFGGVDDTLSSLRKPLFRIPNASRIRVFQLALLLVIAATSFVHMEPEFCRMLCPFKLTGDIAQSYAHPALTWGLSFALVGGVFVVGLPLLTGQRTFCSGVCPFGAIPPLVAGLNPYRVAIRDDACTGCSTCASVCPSFAIDSRPGSASINRYCTACLRCVDPCPANAIRPALFGRRESRLFPWVTLALGGALSVFYVPAGVLALVRIAGGHPA